MIGSLSEEKEKNCHMLITSPLNEGAVIKRELIDHSRMIKRTITKVS
jgi:hypothetical protein